VEEIDLTVVGAGVVGLAVAAKLSPLFKQTFIIEKNLSFGMETSSRNSEVIHAGIYYPRGSLKHELCISGNRQIYEICIREAIGYKKTGKYIIAVTDEDRIHLNELYENGLKNNVPGLAKVSAEELKRKEPGIECVEAIHSESTGIVDSHSLMKYFLHNAQENAAEAVFNTEVIGIECSHHNGYKVTVKENNGEIFSFNSKFIVNCSGLWSDRICSMLGLDVQSLDYKLHFCKGTYFRLNSSSFSKVKSLIYPAVAKDSVSLGIHVTPDMGGALRLGPDAEYTESNDDYSIADKKRREFFGSVSTFLRGIEEEDLYPDTAGIRPKLQGPGEKFRDFIIREESGNGLPGLINLIGIDSPGLTSAPAIADHVFGIVSDIV
jgi:L-2-hydroxyglutarate oxidase LhgO